MNILPKEDILNIMTDYYRENNPDLIITNRIKDTLYRVICDGLNKKKPDLFSEKSDDFIRYLLSEDKVINFIKERQPNTAPVPEIVLDSIFSFFSADSLKKYRIYSVCRKSNHPEDNNLYMVVAKIPDGDYACWTCWNQSTSSLNYGHYCLNSLDACIDVLRDQFVDITWEADKYGFDINAFFAVQERIINRYSIQKKLTESENAYISDIHRRKPSRK